jgi:hypothetical protein
VTPSAADGAKVLAVRAGSSLRLVRHPKGGELALPSQVALELLAGAFLVARQKLVALGFDLVQQGGQA